jgi:peptidoglycan/xylan/chitin deacetylase (PgdA/CDA1 family)
VTSQHVIEKLPFPHDVAAGQPLTPNSLDQLRSLVAAGVEIGAHTRRHCDLGPMRDPAQLEDEVVGSRDELQAALDCPVSHFAFPYGLHRNLNREAFALARKAGYRGVCSAYGGYNLPGEDPFHLQRIHADGEMIRFKNWLTLDPRKLRQVERFHYEPPPCATVSVDAECSPSLLVPPENEGRPRRPAG